MLSEINMYYYYYYYYYNKAGDTNVLTSDPDRRCQGDILPFVTSVATVAQTVVDAAGRDVLRAFGIELERTVESTEEQK